MSRSIKYAGLVGKYIRMDRPATEDEIADGSPPTVGCSGLVSLVYDTTNGGVAIMMDYGMGFTIHKKDEGWLFTIAANQETAEGFGRG